MIDNIEIEIDLLITAIFKKYGYDFSEYSKVSFRRRIENYVIKESIVSIGELIHMILNSEHEMKKLIHSISVTVTEMFRDPNVYKKLRLSVIPYLKTYPQINIWAAGCATGQEVYSLAILLEEENVNNYHIYATDINEKSLKIARDGIYSNEDIKISTLNYQKSGGQLEFSDYYHTKYNSSIFNKKLRKNITFINHNLVCDQKFNHFHLILCRNVLIYFQKNLQKNVINLFNDSLLYNGFLCLGTKESLMFSDESNSFIEFAKSEKIYKKTLK